MPLLSERHTQEPQGLHEVWRTLADGLQVALSQRIGPDAGSGRGHRCPSRLRRCPGAVRSCTRALRASASSRPVARAGSRGSFGRCSSLLTYRLTKGRLRPRLSLDRRVSATATCLFLSNRCALGAPAHAESGPSQRQRATGPDRHATLHRPPVRAEWSRVDDASHCRHQPPDRCPHLAAS